MKVFGTGLSRTGTKSLHVALTELGFRSIHYPRGYHFVDGRIVIDARVLEGFEALLDTPIALDFERLDRRYPGSKFIHTVRQIDDWLESCRHFFPPDKSLADNLAELMVRLYGAPHFDETKFRDAYERHDRRVLDYFADRPADLLMMNICDGDGWEVLCPFLARAPILDRPFPHEIDASSRRRELNLVG